MNRRIYTLMFELSVDGISFLYLQRCHNVAKTPMTYLYV